MSANEPTLPGHKLLERVFRSGVAGIGVLQGAMLMGLAHPLVVHGLIQTVPSIRDLALPDSEWDNLSADERAERVSRVVAMLTDLHAALRDPQRFAQVLEFINQHNAKTVTLREQVGSWDKGTYRFTQPEILAFLYFAIIFQTSDAYDAYVVHVSSEEADLYVAAAAEVIGRPLMLNDSLRGMAPDSGEDFAEAGRLLTLDCEAAWMWYEHMLDRLHVTPEAQRIVDRLLGSGQLPAFMPAVAGDELNVRDVLSVFMYEIGEQYTGFMPSAHSGPDDLMRRISDSQRPTT